MYSPADLMYVDQQVGKKIKKRPVAFKSTATGSIMNMMGIKRKKRKDVLQRIKLIEGGYIDG